MSELTIHEACQRGDLDVVLACIDSDPTRVDADDQYDWRPLFHAGLRKHEAIVRALLDAGADVSAHDGYVLHFAGEVPGNKAIVGLLITAGALDSHVRPVSDLNRQFLVAVFLADDARVTALLRLHPELATTIDGRGDHPIHHAARNGDHAIVELLLDAGADANAIGHDGNTLLYCAGGHGHTDVVRLLLERGADPDAPLNEDGQTLAQWLSQYPDDPRIQSVARYLDEFSGD